MNHPLVLFKVRERKMKKLLVVVLLWVPAYGQQITDVMLRSAVSAQSAPKAFWSAVPNSYAWVDLSQATQARMIVQVGSAVAPGEQLSIEYFVTPLNATGNTMLDIEPPAFQANNWFLHLVDTNFSPLLQSNQLANTQIITPWFPVPADAQTEVQIRGVIFNGGAQAYNVSILNMHLQYR
jgi:hypothetical protein